MPCEAGPTVEWREGINLTGNTGIMCFFKELIFSVLKMAKCHIDALKKFNEVVVYTAVAVQWSRGMGVCAAAVEAP